eukprot:CAMPEP_0113441010 /NCGR_PEP_ID=MMETSP0014_2-20120614/854_1 /TAXON_ID=2857 /ORGANISM="Nitzschia sp." /LENGTH=1701 /DNA_ID=CAMNT_0000331825 /DNA_START=113 /DNA_END=5219 /DNA_ORIENTATION=+ /assembly_acc=CAM_ASM_000159
MSSVEENNIAVGSSPSSDEDATATATAAAATTTTQESSGGESDNNGGDIYQHNNYVYILDKEYSWVPAMVTERINETTMNLSIPKYKTEQAIRCDGGRTASRFEKQTIDLNDPKTVALYPNKHLPLQNVNHEGELQVVEDMVDLPFLHEAAILYNLKRRHITSLPYTRVADIVIAVNPYQWFHHLYSEKERARYSQALVWDPLFRQTTSSSSKQQQQPSSSSSSALDSPKAGSAASSSSTDAQDPRTKVPPHVYETSCLAYKGLVRDEEDQSILVSGESGAGKTETVKILLRNLACIQDGGIAGKNKKADPSSPAKDQQPQQDNIIVQRVLDSNPLLEAFGNATTIRNDNSSRFGKYLQLQFDSMFQGGSVAPAILAGSKCEVYLLEKSRVTHHDPSERTYHIFYQLLSAPEELKVAIWDGLADTDAESFCYVGLTESDSPSAMGIIEGKTDAERFQQTLEALEIIGVLETTAHHVIAITRVADIVIAVNPYQWFHHLYSEKERTRYSQALVWDPLFRQTTSSSSKQQQQQSSSSSSALDSPKAGSAASSSSTDAQDPRTKHPPHVYETSCLAYKGLVRDEEDQSILVSGESGAGKTETVKILLRNLASIQDGGIAGKNKKADPSSPAKDQQPQQDNIIVQRVLDSNPLLEAFGNATTIRNDNSSRFGKYLQLQFDSMFQGGSVAPAILAGSKCEVYLLEKSRVTHHDPSERTYHIFYQLLSAPEELKVAIWDGLADTDAESFCYVGLTESDSPSAMGIIEGKTDAERFQQTLEALEIIGVKGAILQMLLRAICVVLQLGNLEFAPASIPQGNSSAMTALGLPVHHPTGGNSDASEISSLEELQDLSSLMGMNDIDSSEDGVSNTLQAALTVRTVEARGEVFAVPLTPEKAKESADAFAKEIYAKTFLWLVRTINDATCAEKNYSRAGTQRSVPLKYSIIGLLDIFGFETFETNRFEQLCINYCNEKLQQKFTQDIFRSVQIEYENEGIELGEITYDDNTDALDLVEGRMGLLAFLNEECVRPKGSDKTFVYKSEAMNKENPCFFRDKHARDTVFGIRHYAGPVVYDATGFVVKNTDTLPSDLMDCAKLSSNEIISKEITNESMMNPLHINSVSSSGATKKKRPKSSQAASSNPKELQKRTSNIVAETVWTKFKNQLSSLMVSLSTTKTRYIRCIKPNSQKAPLLMEHASTVDQLRCAGVVAAVTISRSAFPNRLEHMAVLDRFKSLWPKGGHLAALQDQTLDPEERRSKATEILLTIALKDMEFEKNGNKFRAFVMGRTRAYFRSGALEFLEAERLKHLGTYATIVQRNARRYIVQSKYRRHRAAVIKLQARYRRLRQQTLYKRLRDTSIRVQCWYRIIFAKRAIFHLRRKVNATKIQTRWRTTRDSKRFRSMVSSVVVIQAMVRGSLQRPKYRQALIDKAEQAKLENQLTALQRKLEEAETKRLEAEKAAEERAMAAVAQYKEEQKVDDSFQDAVEEEEDSKANENAPSSQTAAGPADQSTVVTQEEEAKDLSSDQQQLMDESSKMLEYLRKEVFKLRSQNQQLKTDFDLLKDNNQRLMDANASAGASFAALNQHAKQLSKQNAQIGGEVHSFKEQTQKLNVMLFELKEELKMKNATYAAEVQSRLQYQKALQKITDMITDSCRDHRLVERVLKVADDVEMDLMSTDSFDHGGTNLDTDDDEDVQNQGSRSGLLGFFGL